MELESLRLETSRLLLRVPTRDDIEPWVAMMADEETTRFIGGASARSAAWRGLMTMIGAWHAHGFAMFSVIEKSSGQWIGRLGPWRPPDWPGPEIGWAIIRQQWGRGYATEGSAASIDWAFDRLGWSEVIHSIDADNHASQEVARKLGSQNRGRGTLPPPFEHAVVDIWGQSREQWRTRRR